MIDDDLGVAAREATQDLIDLLSIDMLELDDLGNHPIFHGRRALAAADWVRGARVIFDWNNSPKTTLPRDREPVRLKGCQESSISLIDCHRHRRIDRDLLSLERLWNDDILLFQTRDELNNRFKLLIVDLEIDFGPR